MSKANMGSAFFYQASRSFKAFSTIIKSIRAFQSIPKGYMKGILRIINDMGKVFSLGKTDKLTKESGRMERKVVMGFGDLLTVTSMKENGNRTS